jgi:hypothetical protein
VTSEIAQQSFWSDDHDPELERGLKSGHLVTILSVAARRVLKAIDSGHDYDAAVALLRDVLPNPPADYDPRPYVAAQAWTFAKTMPDNPHEYVLIRKSTDWRAHLCVLSWLRAHGEVEKFMGRTYRFRTVDDHHYWVLGPSDTIINRRKAPQGGE